MSPVHKLAPNLRILFRGAVDVLLAPLARALRARPQDRPWFVYGMNFFTSRMEDALNKGPAKTLRQPLMISDFAPAALRATERAAAYRELRGIIRSHRSTLLGGCGYV